MCLACRLARLTRSRRWHCTPSVRTNTPVSTESSKLPPIFVRNSCVAVISPRRYSSSGEEALGLLDARSSLKFKCQSGEGTSTYCRTGTADGGPRSGAVVMWVNAECFSCLSRCRKRSPDRTHVCSRILFGGRGAQAPRLYLHLVRRCCFIATLDRQIRLSSGADLFLSRSRRPPRLALTCRRWMYNTTRGYKNTSTKKQR